MTPKVLIVDDEDAARYGIRRGLAGQGYELTEAGSGRAALDQIRAAQPDVVVSDVNMPEMDGLTLLREIASAVDAPVVVLITAYGSERVAIDALRSGAYDYLSKPFELDELRAVVRNAVERRRLERENREYQRRLQETMAELVRSEKIAALGRLAAGLAHELNNPLGALVSGIDTMDRAARRIAAGGTPAGALEAMHSAAEQTRAACERIRGIVANLGAFAQLDRADLRRVSIREGLESALTLGCGGVEIETEFGPLPEIACRPRDLNQLFLNLLENAREAIGRSNGSGRIVVRARVEDQRVVVEIEDNGCGIAPEALPRIFDPGFTTKGRGVGAGLGLAICHRIAAEHGGSIEVESREGEGSRFRVVLPC